MDGVSLTDEQTAALTNFQEVTQIESYEDSLQYLTMNDWNVERAVNTALSLSTDAPPSPAPTRSDRQLPHGTSVTTRYMPSYALQLFRTPLSFLYTFYVKVQPLLPWNILRGVVSFVRSLLWRAPQRTAIEEVEDYYTYFSNKYGSKHPTFYRGTLSQALRDAQREVRLLFVYLHDKSSVLCDRFAREILCGEGLSIILGNHLFWSTSRDTQEGVEASRLLTVNAFPCLCIVAHHGSQRTVQLKLDRYSDPDCCIAEILAAVENADHTLEYNRRQRTQSNSRDRLLEEQNAAYQDAMRVDQEKAEQRKREQQERRRVEEEQQRKLQESIDFREHLKQTLPDEPAATEEDIIQVSIRLPADEPIRRRFRRADPAKLLFEFAWTNDQVPDRFELLWGYPRKRFQYELMADETIGDVMSGRTETCFLEEVDDEK